MNPHTTISALPFHSNCNKSPRKKAKVRPTHFLTIIGGGTQPPTYYKFHFKLNRINNCGRFEPLLIIKWQYKSKLFWFFSLIEYFSVNFLNNVSWLTTLFGWLLLFLTKSLVDYTSWLTTTFLTTLFSWPLLENAENHFFLTTIDPHGCPHGLCCQCPVLRIFRLLELRLLALLIWLRFRNAVLSPWRWFGQQSLVHRQHLRWCWWWQQYCKLVPDLFSL